ncbi:MAG: MFS transporter [Gammaproteobacteria bacterium]|nr:MFS transporter [Gammaproteobacteria bacterium]
MTSMKLPIPVYLLALGYGLGSTVAVISVAIAGIIGDDLAPYPELSTLPYGLQFIGVMFSAFTSSLLQGKFGRKRVVFAACYIGILAGGLGFVCLMKESFILMCITHFMIGIFLANIGLLRFAALDITPKKLHGKALSMVMFGGTFAAIIGPFISRNAADLAGTFSTYQISYLAMMCIAALIGFMVLFLHFPDPIKQKNEKPILIRALLSNQLYVFAIICGGVGYSLMNMIMINSSIQMKLTGFSFHSVSYYIQIHVLAMFVPSLFNMKLLDYMGIKNFLVTGFILQILVSVIFFFGQNSQTFLLSLLFLGLSWNMLYTSASYIIGHVFDDPATKFKAQGVNDLFVGMMSAIGALSAGVILGVLGWELMHTIAVFLTIALVLFFMTIRVKLVERLK